MPRLWSRLPLPEQHLVGIPVGLALDRLIGRRGPRWTRPIGLPLAAAGVLVNLAAVRARGADPLEQPSRLVQSGIYAVTRHPMYVGWSMIHLGTALLLCSPGIALSWPVAVALVHREIRREERQLAKGFGAEFAAYAALVPRYVNPSSTLRLIRSARARGRRRPPRSVTKRPA
jgi:protein-S-isoprenylcysteine O-methyltransferase Ste14